MSQQRDPIESTIILLLIPMLLGLAFGQMTRGTERRPVACYTVPAPGSEP